MFLTATMLLLPRAASQTRFDYKNVSIADLGYTSSVVMSGQKPYQAFFFQLPRGTVVTESSYVQMHLRFSEALDRGSVVKISVNDIPLRTYTLGQLRSHETTLQVPLRSVAIPSAVPNRTVETPRFLKVVVEGYLSITGDMCRDIESGALYIVIENSSYARLALSREQRSLSIASFLNDTDGDIYVVVPGYLSLSLVESALWVMADLKKRFLHTKRQVKLYDGKVQASVVQHLNYVVVTDFSYLATLPAPFDSLAMQALGVVQGTLHDDGLLLLETAYRTNRLFIAGESAEGLTKAASAFLIDNMRSSMLGRRARVQQIEVPIARRFPNPPYSVSLEQLGFENVTLKGLGLVRAGYRVLRQSLGDSPRDISFHLLGSTTVVREDEDAYMNVYFNDILLDSWHIRGSGAFSKKVVSLPNYALREENRVDVEFLYYPSDSCRAATFIGNLFNTSYFEVGSHRAPESRLFESIPETFSSNTVLVLSPEVSRALFKAAATLLSVLDRDVNARYLYPPVVISSSFTNAMAETTNVIAVLSPSDTVLNVVGRTLPADPTKSFRVINTQNNEDMFVLKPEFSLGMLQVGRVTPKTATLLAFPIGDGGEQLLLDFLTTLRQNPRLMEGNIGLYGVGGDMYFFNTEKRTASIAYVGEESLLDFIGRHRFVIFIFLWLVFTAVVIAVSFYIQRQRLKSAEAPKPGS
jgi:hypothetical protein